VADRSPGPKGGSPSLIAQATELWELVRGYVVQEIKAPLVGVGRFVGFGLAGSLLLGIGSSLVALALLRFLQTETGTAFDGHLSFVPYLIVVVACGAVIALAASRMGSKAVIERGPAGKDEDRD
jgi:hypothetical protein